MDSEKSGYSDNNGASEDGAISTNGVFVKKIMCPPRTRIKYFFTGNGKKFVSCLNQISVQKNNMTGNIFFVRFADAWFPVDITQTNVAEPIPEEDVFEFD